MDPAMPMTPIILTNIIAPIIGFASLIGLFLASLRVLIATPATCDGVCLSFVRHISKIKRLRLVSH